MAPEHPLEALVREGAECRGMHEVFLNVRGLSGAETAMIRDTCAHCPVRPECRIVGDHIESHVRLVDLAGVWGGEFPQERIDRRNGVRRRYQSAQRQQLRIAARRGAA